MEKDIQIKASDGMTIKGILYGNNKEKLVIFLHGLANVYRDTYLIRHSVEFFIEKGYSVFIYNQYSDDDKDGKKPRALYGSVTLLRHSEDVKDVVKHLEEQYDNLFLIGHSFGGLTLSQSNIKCKSQALWDPTFDVTGWRNEDNISYMGKVPTLTWFGLKYVINEEMVDGAEKITKDVAEKWCRAIQSPTLVVNTTACHEWNKYYKDYLPSHSEFETMDTSHTFHHFGKVQELCEKTHTFFKKEIK